jgi:adenylate cyclase
MRLRNSIRAGASRQRLADLLEQRLVPGADREAVDQRIWDLFGERWAVMFTDLSGFSRQVANYGITHFLQTMYESERLLVPIINAHDGILLKVEGDSLMVIFRRAESAVAAAIAMQQQLRHYNIGREPAEQVLLCVGLGFGDVLRIGDEDVFGAEVNAASKLGEDTADPWEILVTGNVLECALKHPGVSGAEALDEAPPGAVAAHRLVYDLP